MELVVSTDARLRSALGANMTFRWTGQPAQGLLLHKGDLVAIPFSLFWSGMVLTAFWANFARAPVVLIFFAPFLLVAAYIVAGRFVTDAYRRAHTAYALTDEGAYEVYDGIHPSVTMVGGAGMFPMKLTRRNDGSGTIAFGPHTSWRIRTADLFGGHEVLCFEGVRDAYSVYRIAEQIAIRR